MQGVYKKNLIKISTFFASVLESDLMLGKWSIWRHFRLALWVTIWSAYSVI